MVDGRRGHAERHWSIGDAMFLVACVAVVCWTATWLPEVVMGLIARVRLGPGPHGGGLFLPPGSR